MCVDGGGEQPGQQAEQKQLRQLQEHSFALEERLRDALDDADRAQRDRESMRRELDQVFTSPKLPARVQCLQTLCCVRC